MKALYRSFLQVFKRGNSSVTKIMLLGIGLAMGLILIAKIYFEQTFEAYVPNLERTYRILPLYEKDGKLSDYQNTPGAIAPGIERYSPAVELFTRYTGLGDDVIVKKVDQNGIIDDKLGYKSKKVIMADSTFFDIFSRTVYGENAKSVLSKPSYALVSRSFAQMLMGNAPIDGAIGTAIAAQANPETKLTIGGVFEDFPKNSELAEVQIVISLSTIGKYMGDGRDNWLGNDRYSSYVRLTEGSPVEDVKKGIDRMCEQNLPNEELLKSGLKISYTITPLETYHTSNIETKRLCNILLLLAFSVLITAILNYVLITISEMVRRVKTVAVHKCYGASRFNIYGMLLSDAFVHLLLSITIAVLLVISFDKVVEALIGTTIISLLNGTSIVILLIVCTLVFAVCGLLPGLVYAKIPVASVFRRYKESNRRWKHILLFIQFVASTFFITLLLVVLLQYRYMLNNDPGYTYNNLVFLNVDGISAEKRDLLKTEVAKLPFVVEQSFSTTIPIHGASGNNVFILGDGRTLFNIADCYDVDKGYFKLMEIPIVEGRNFNEEGGSGKEVMVSKSFEEKMKTVAGWTDGAIGKAIGVTEHCQGKDDFYTICGVYPDFLIGYIGNNDTRPSVMFYSGTDYPWFSKYLSYYLIKLDGLTPEKIAAINSEVKRVVPDKEISLQTYVDEFYVSYADSRRFRDSVLIAGLVVLLITLIGLIGYSLDEINRRRSEIAIRKINGATLPELLGLFLKNIIRISLPSIIIGCVAAYLVGERWLEQFSQKISLHWWLFVISGLFTLLLVVTIALITTYRAANANPVENLKNE